MTTFSNKPQQVFLHTSGSYHLSVSSPSLSLPPTIPQFPSLHLSIVTRSALRALQRVDPTTLAPGGWGDKLSVPSPGFHHHSSRFHSLRSLPFCLFLLMWGLSFSGSLASLGAISLFTYCFFILFLPFFYHTFSCPCQNGERLVKLSG